MAWRTTKILDFLETIPSAQTQAEVCVEVGRAARALGMTWFFFGGAVPPGHPMLPSFKHHNWSSDMIDAFGSNELIELNPVPRISALSHRTVTLTEYWRGAAGFAPNPACAPLFDHLAHHRMTHFLIVPIHGPRGPRGFGMLSNAGPDPTPRERGLMGLLCHVGFLRLSELDGLTHRQSGNDATLTDREMDMLMGLSQGMGDAEIASTHKITVRTVRFHIGNAKRKLGARSRGEALLLVAKGGFFPQ